MKSHLPSSIIPSIIGWSMAPLIKPGCRLVIDFKNKNYHLGDVVVFSKENRILAHRIISVNKQKKLSLLKGDNNPRPDGWFDSRKIIGRIEKIIYPDYIVDLNSKKNQIAKYIFLFYSHLNYLLPFFSNIRQLYKIPILKKIYRFVLKGNRLE